MAWFTYCLCKVETNTIVGKNREEKKITTRYRQAYVSVISTSPCGWVLVVIKNHIMHSNVVYIRTNTTYTSLSTFYSVSVIVLKAAMSWTLGYLNIFTAIFFTSSYCLWSSLQPLLTKIYLNLPSYLIHFSYLVVVIIIAAKLFLLDSAELLSYRNTSTPTSNLMSV